MNTIQFAPLSKEKTYETVNRALKNAVLNNKTVEVLMFGNKYPVKPTDTHDSLTPLKSLLHAMSELQVINDKVSARV